MRLFVLALALVPACGGPPDPPDRPTDEADTDADTDADSDADTDRDTGGHSARSGHSGASDGISATCARQADNALRVDCDVVVDPPGPISVTWTPAGGGDPRTMRWPEASGSRRVTLHRMVGETDHAYTFTAEATGARATGSFRSGPVPPTGQVGWSVTGAAPPADDVLFQVSCDGPAAVVLDPQGRVVWYQDLDQGLAPGPHKVNATNVATSGGVASILDQEAVRWFGWDGALRFEARRGVTLGFDDLVHHDVFERGGRLWVLSAGLWVDGGVDYIVDGLYVFDAGGALLADWSLLDVVTPTGGAPGGTPGYWSAQFPGADDWSHGNGIFVDERQDVLLSFFALDTVIRVAGDPTAAGFGELAAVVAGDPRSSPWPSDFTITDPSGLTDDLTFSHQHHPSSLPSGELQLFDNEAVGPSRVLRLALDPATGEAAITGSWPVGATCPFEGSAYVRSDGTLLATCASLGAFVVIDPGSGDTLGTMRPRCGGGRANSAVLARGVPVAL